MKRVIVVLLVLLLAGCGSPAVPPLSPQQAAEAETDNLCWGYGQYAPIESGAAGESRAAIRAELTKRNAINPQEWAMIDGGTLNVGMRRCAVYAALGRPVIHDPGRNGAEVLSFKSNMFVTLNNGVLVDYGGYGVLAR